MAFQIGYRRLLSLGLSLSSVWIPLSVRGNPTAPLVRMQAESLNQQGAAKVLRLDLEGALPDFNQALALDPTYADAYVNRSMLHNRLQNPEAALADAAQALELAPDMAEAYTSRGVAHLALGDPDAAEADWEKAAELFQQQKRVADLLVVKSLLQQLQP
ncbi:MAG: tetratricopeptide repeat protein [Synechococcaceae cyanobacterium SM2_3_1]|nr:tetratricopeptide repeat protein [Synechococcaceae cyanobacterium SM2_3_1]